MFRLGDLAAGGHNLLPGAAVFKTLHADASIAAAVELPPAQPRPWSAGQLLAAALVLIILAAGALYVDLPLASYIRVRGLPESLRRFVQLAETFGWGGTFSL